MGLGLEFGVTRPLSTVFHSAAVLLIIVGKKTSCPHPLLNTLTSECQVTHEMVCASRTKLAKPRVGQASQGELLPFPIHLTAGNYALCHNGSVGRGCGAPAELGLRVFSTLHLQKARPCCVTRAGEQTLVVQCSSAETTSLPVFKPFT